jgi:ribosome-binding factor A
MTEGRRTKRVAELIQGELGNILLTEIDDPSLSTLVITSVRVSDDLSIAWVAVKTLSGADDARARRRVLSALSRAGSRIRRALAPRLELRRQPELRFSWDLGHDNVRRVEELLTEIADERSEDDSEG